MSRTAAACSAPGEGREEGAGLDGDGSFGDSGRQRRQGTVLCLRTVPEPQRNFSIFLFLMKMSQNPVSRNRIDKSVRIDLADHFRDTFYVRAGHD